MEREIDKKNVVLQNDENKGQVQIADDVVAVIAGIATTEVDGVASMAGNISKELISKLGMKNLSKGVKVQMEDGVAIVDVAVNIEYGYNIYLYRYNMETGEYTLVAQ